MTKNITKYWNVLTNIWSNISPGGRPAWPKCVTKYNTKYWNVLQIQIQIYNQIFHLADAQLGPNAWQNTIPNIAMYYKYKYKYITKYFTWRTPSLAKICDQIHCQILKCTTTKYFTWRTPSLAPGSGAGMASPPPLQTSLQQIWVRNANIKFFCKIWKSSKTV